MTKLEKVIKGLECCTSDVSCAECLYRGKRDGALNCVRELSTDALELLKEREAVEPKEIVNEHYPIGDYRRTNGWLCGKCGETLMGDANYCSYCGRAVEWE